MIPGIVRFMLKGQKHRAKEIGNALAPQEGEYDNHAHDRIRKNKTIKGEAKILDRGLEQACLAAGIDPAGIDIELIQDDPAIKNLDTAEPKPFQQPNDTTEQQIRMDYDT